MACYRMKKFMYIWSTFFHYEKQKLGRSAKIETSTIFVTVDHLKALRISGDFFLI